MGGTELWNEDLERLLLRLLVALGIGFLIGLEREHAKRVVEDEEQFGGVRTYTIIALFGFVAAFLAERFGAALFIVGLAACVVMVLASYMKSTHPGSIGMTTEFSAVVVFLLGALVFNGHLLLAVIIAVIVTLLLSFKLPLHRFIETLTPQEIRAIVLFVIISAVVLPALPRERFGPDDVWDLRDIWTMVVLVTGMSLVGYLLAKILGARKGTVLTGAVGGLVSSTAVTLGLARHTRRGGAASAAAVGIIAATAVLYPRVLIETFAVNQALARRLALPVLAIAAVAFAAAFMMHRRVKSEEGNEVPLRSPLNFLVALQFAAIYMAVQWLISMADQHFSSSGIYATSLVVGTTDMDAITLSLARKSTDPASYHQGVIAILLATLSNTVMKYGIILFFGDRRLRALTAIGFGAIAVATVIVLLILRVL